VETATRTLRAVQGRKHTPPHALHDVAQNDGVQVIVQHNVVHNVHLGNISVRRCKPAPARSRCEAQSALRSWFAQPDMQREDAPWLRARAGSCGARSSHCTRWLLHCWLPGGRRGLLRQRRRPWQCWRRFARNRHCRRPPAGVAAAAVADTARRVSTHRLQRHGDNGRRQRCDVVQTEDGVELVHDESTDSGPCFREHSRC
jgi:hypothetical protein